MWHRGTNRKHSRPHTSCANFFFFAKSNELKAQISKLIFLFLFPQIRRFWFSFVCVLQKRESVRLILRVRVLLTHSLCRFEASRRTKERERKRESLMRIIYRSRDLIYRWRNGHIHQPSVNLSFSLVVMAFMWSWSPRFSNSARNYHVWNHFSEVFGAFLFSRLIRVLPVMWSGFFPSNSCLISGISRVLRTVRERERGRDADVYSVYEAAKRQQWRIYSTGR